MQSASGTAQSEREESMCRLRRDEHKDIVGALGISACHKFAANDNAAFRESDFFADLQHPSQPARFTAGPMNLEQISRSLRSFLLMGMLVAIV